MNKVLQDALTKALSKVNVVEVVDGVQNGLMKTHEVVGHVADTIADEALALGVDMQDAIMAVSTKLDEYAGLAQAVSKASGTFKSTPAPDANNTQDWETQTRDQKIAAIIKYFGFVNNEDTRAVYAKYPDEELDAILRVINKYT